MGVRSGQELQLSGMRWRQGRGHNVAGQPRLVWPPFTLIILSYIIILLLETVYCQKIGINSWVIGKNRICEVTVTMTFDLRPPICTRLIFVSKWKRVPKFKKLPQGVLKISRWQKWVRPVCICIQIGGWTSWKYYASGRGYRPLGCVTKHPYTVCRRGIKAAQNERKALVAIVVSVLPTDKCISTAAHICRSPFLL